MVQRIHNLTKWALVEEGQAAMFDNDKPRVVILEVNCPSEVCFYVSLAVETSRRDDAREGDEEAGRRSLADVLGVADAVSDRSTSGGRTVTFLALCKGRDRLEFAVPGAFELLVEGGNAYVSTADGQEIATKLVAPYIFTRIANRRQRNPHLEMMEYQMRLNQERMAAAMAEEVDRRMQALEEKYAPQRDIRTPPERLGRPADAEPASGSEQRSGGSGEGGEDAGESGAGEKPARKRKPAPAASDD